MKSGKIFTTMMHNVAESIGRSVDVVWGKELRWFLGLKLRHRLGIVLLAVLLVDGLSIEECDMWKRLVWLVSVAAVLLIVKDARPLEEEE